MFTRPGGSLPGRVSWKERGDVLMDLKSIEHAWSTLSPLLFVPHSEAEYDRLVKMLDALIDDVGEDESSPFASLMEVIGVLIEKYEDEHVEEITAA